MYRKLIDEDERFPEPLLMVLQATGDVYVANNPRELVGAYLGNPDYDDIQDGDVSAYLRKRAADDARIFGPLMVRRVPKYPIGWSTDREFLKGLALNGWILIYEKENSYRVRPESPELPPIEHHCSKCVFDKGNEKCAQFEAWADDDGANCMGFARNDVTPSDNLTLVTFGHPEEFFDRDPEKDAREADEYIFSHHLEDDEE